MNYWDDVTLSAPPAHLSPSVFFSEEEWAVLSIEEKERELRRRYLDWLTTKAKITISF